MSSTRKQELTAAIRIRDAAITLFAERGFAATTIREIAKLARVSPGLVIHHYRDKVGLRRSCDEYVVRIVIEAKAALHGDLRAAMADYLLNRPPELPPPGYFARMVQDGSEEGQHLFDALVARTRVALEDGLGEIAFRPVQDVEAMAVLLTTYGIAVLIMQDHVARHFGVEAFEPQTNLRLVAARYDLFTEALLKPSPSPGGQVAGEGTVDGR